MSDLSMEPSGVEAVEHPEDMEPMNTNNGESGSYFSNSHLNSSTEGETASGEEQQQQLTEDILQSYSTTSDESYGANDDDDYESVTETSSSGSSARMENYGFDGVLSNHSFGGWKMVDGVKQISFCGDFVMYDSIYSTKCELIFSESFFEAKGQPAYGSQDDFCVRMSLENIVHIESHWFGRHHTAKVFISATSENEDPGPKCQFSVIKKLEFAVVDPCWNEKVDEIQSLHAYNAVWKVKIDCEVGPYGDTLEQKMLPYEMSYFPTFKPFEGLVYPKGDADPVCISKSDVDLLQPDTFVNDTIIDFYIKYLVDKMPLEKRQRFHFFNSFFFRKLADWEKYPSGSFDGRATFLRVRKWTRKVNLFEKDYIFIPVNHNYHWSLLVICHPGEVANLRDEDVKKLDRVPCILHMDSIRGTHVDLKDRIQSYLCEEWKEKHKETSEDISSKFLNLNFVSLEIPQQQNSYDCGLFLLHYVERFLEEEPASISPFKISPLIHFLTTDWFPSAAPSLKRRDIQKLIFELLENHSIESTPASGADRSHPFNKPKIENALEFPSNGLSKGCKEEHLLPSQAEAGLEMTLLPASSLRASYCTSSNDMVVGELFEAGSATGFSLDRQYQTLDRMSSFNEFKSALASIEEAVGTGEKVVHSTPNGPGYPHIEGVASETADYACFSKELRTEISWNGGNFINQTCKRAVASLPVKSVFYSDNSLEELQQIGKCQAVKMIVDENLDQVGHTSTGEDQWLTDCITTNASVMQEVEDPHCSIQPIVQNYTSDSPSACPKNLFKLSDLSNGAAEGNVDAEELESELQHAAKRMRISPSSEVEPSKSNPHCPGQPIHQSDTSGSLNACWKDPSMLLNLGNGAVEGNVAAVYVDAEEPESELQHAAKRLRLSPSSEVEISKSMPEGTSF